MPRRAAPITDNVEARDASPVTSNVESKVTASSTFNVPFTVVIAPEDATLTAPPPVANEVAPLESNVETEVSPVTSNVPPAVVAELHRSQVMLHQMTSSYIKCTTVDADVAPIVVASIVSTINIY